MAKRGDRCVGQGSAVSLFSSMMGGVPEEARLRNRRYLVICLAAGGLAMCLVVLSLSVFRGFSGLIGALLGLLLVCLFFGSSLIALILTRNSSAATVASVLIALYAGKLVLVVAAIIGLRPIAGIDHLSFFLSVVVGALIATVSGLFLWTKLQFPYVRT